MTTLDHARPGRGPRVLPAACAAVAVVVAAWIWLPRFESAALEPAHRLSERAAVAEPAVPNRAPAAETLAEKLMRSDEEFRRALDALGRSDPVAAIEAAQSLGRDEDERALWVADQMQAWARREPTAAWQWLLQQEHRIDDLAHGTLPAVVLNVIATRDPDLLTALVASQLGPVNGAGPFAGEIVAHLGMQAFVAAGQVDLAARAVEQWARDPVVGPLGSSAYSTVALAMMAADPTQAGTWLTQFPPSADRSAALAVFAAGWAESDPVRALAWGEQLPASERSGVIDRVFTDWVERDTASAAEWLSDTIGRISSGPEVDRRIEQVLALSYALREQPTTALRWAANLSDPVARARHEERILLRWGDRDPAGAVEYIQRGPGIVAERKPELIRKLYAARGGRQFDD